MKNDTATTVMAIYRVQSAKMAAFMELLKTHHPVLHELGLVTDEAPIVYSGHEKEGGPIVFEIFSWKSPDASDSAHQMPEVARVWEAMGTMTEDRNGRPQFEFPHVERVDLGQLTT